MKKATVDVVDVSQKTDGLARGLAHAHTRRRVVCLLLWLRSSSRPIPLLCNPAVPITQDALGNCWTRPRNKALESHFSVVQIVKPFACIDLEPRDLEDVLSVHHRVDPHVLRTGGSLTCTQHAPHRSAVILGACHPATRPEFILQHKRSSTMM